VLFFFFRNIVAANFSPRALFQDWLAQLLPYSPKLQFALESRLTSCLDEIADDELIQLFLEGVSCVPRLYCVGDALDEMTTENRSFLDNLNRLATFRPHSLKLLITSRPKQYLQSALRDSSIVHVSLQQKLVDLDIHAFLNHRFDTAQKSNAQHALKQDVISMVTRRSEGLFLYAKLTIDQVEAALLSEDPIDIDRLERSLPLGLEQTYTSVLAKQRAAKNVNVQLQVFVLEAVTHAARPLRLNELASLIECFYPYAAAAGGFKPLVATCCGPLVEILEDETLQVIHHSFTEFLRGETRAEQNQDSSVEFPIIDEGKAHKQMAINCLKYLRSGALLFENERGQDSVVDTSTICSTPRHQIDLHVIQDDKEHLGLAKEDDKFEYHQACLAYPFLGYAVDNWAYHTSRYDVKDTELYDTIASFINPNDLSFRRWLAIMWGPSSKNKNISMGTPTALHIAAFCGLSRLVSKLIDQGLAISAKDTRKRIPLHWAAQNGHDQVVLMLIQKGSDLNAADAHGLKPIHLAATRNHGSTVRILLQAGVKPDTFKTKEDHIDRPMSIEDTLKEECAIFYAIKAGHTDVLMAMIPFCKGDVLERLLCECCLYGRAEVVLAILEQTDVSPNAMWCEATALFLACRSVNVRCVEALTARGADVLKVSSWRLIIAMTRGCVHSPQATTPIEILIRSWEPRNDAACQTILQMLLDAGLGLDHMENGYTPLLLAAKSAGENGCFLALRTLIDKGADVHKIGPDGNTVLHFALESLAPLEIVKILLNHGIDPNHEGRNSDTALNRLIGEPNPRKPDRLEEIVQCLLDHGAKPKEGSWNLVLIDAMRKNEAVFRTLFSKCTDETAKKRAWFGLSHLCQMEEFPNYVDLFLSEGFDIDVRQDNGYTLYLDCLGYEKASELLRNRGAKQGVIDGNGNNSLHLLTMHRLYDRGRLEDLIENGGLDPLSTNRSGRTLLHHVARDGDESSSFAEHVRWLVSLGVPVNAVDKDGATALHLHQTGNPHKTNVFTEAINCKNDVDFEILDCHGLTVLHQAVMRNVTQVDYLTRTGANVGTLTRDEQNVLHLACRARKTNIVGHLLDLVQSDQVNQQDVYGRTPLHYACSSGEAESVALLLKHGASVHIEDLTYCTPLHACAQSKLEQKMWNSGYNNRWLRKPVPDPLRPDIPYKRNNPVSWSDSGPTEPKFNPGVAAIVRMLVSAGADVSLTDDMGRTALDIAIELGCEEFTEVFAMDEALCNYLLQNSGTEDWDIHEEHILQEKKAYMLLMRPRSVLDALRGDTAALEHITKFPGDYLELMTGEDAAEVIYNSFDLDQPESDHYIALEKLVWPKYAHIAQKVPRLLSYYSSHACLRATGNRRDGNGRHWGCTRRTTLQLACAVSTVNLKTVEYLVEELRVDVNAQAVVFPEGDADQILASDTALHVLASADHWWQLRALEYLIAHGADVNIQNECGKTPLHIASSGRRDHIGTLPNGYWRLKAVEILLSHGADVNIIDKKGETALHKASMAPDIMRLLLRRGADKEAGTRSPLFNSIKSQNVETLKILLDHGVDVDCLDPVTNINDVHHSLRKLGQVYALLCAAFSGQWIGIQGSLLSTLIQYGANLYVTLNDSETLVHFLFEYPEYAILDTLLEEPCVSKIDFNHRDQRGRTVLMAACDWHRNLRHHEYSSRVLEGPESEKLVSPPLRILGLGADASMVDEEGKTALHHLVNNSNMPDDVLMDFVKRDEVLSTLLLKDSHGFTPFHYALRTLRPQLCELMLSKGADLLEPDPNGMTALHHIADQCLQVNRPSRRPTMYISVPKDYFNRCLGLWNMFLGMGGSINVVNNMGDTPLFRFLLSPNTPRREGNSCHLACYDKLFPADSGVDVFATNNQGETALHIISRRQNVNYAKESHDKLLFEAMMAKGLDPLKEDGKGRSALDVASAVEKNDIVRLLGRK
jgi:ankyrin repeat protein